MPTASLGLEAQIGISEAVMKVSETAAMTRGACTICCVTRVCVASSVMSAEDIPSIAKRPTREGKGRVNENVVCSIAVVVIMVFVAI